MRYAPLALCLIVLLCSAATAMAAPCTAATPACTEFVTPGPAPVRVLVYRSFPLDVKNADITRAVVMVHGAGRDAATISCTRWPRRSWPARSTPPW